MDNNDREIRLYTVIQGIPVGKVATYGQIASLAGLPGAARLVGKILCGLPEDTSLPWHRVIIVAGMISLPVGCDCFIEQKKRGGLKTDDPELAADIFQGMLMHAYYLKTLYSMPLKLNEESMKNRAKVIVEKFIKIYKR